MRAACYNYYNVETKPAGSGVSGVGYHDEADNTRYTILKTQYPTLRVTVTSYNDYHESYAIVAYNSRLWNVKIGWTYFISFADSF